jgi:Domain of unknown function (DUF5615)
MIRFLTDENFNGDIVRGLRLRDPSIDLVRAIDVRLGHTEDQLVLEWAAREGRVILSHDVSTMTFYAYERVRTGMPMPGVFEVPEWLGVGPAIEDLLLIAGASLDGEWEGQVRYLPLR